MKGEVKQWRFVCRSCAVPPQAHTPRRVGLRVGPPSEFVDATHEASREFVDATHEAWSATAELIESVMKGSTQAAALILRRITRNDLATAVTVLLKVTHTSVSKAASLVAGMVSLSAKTTAGLLIAMMDASWNLATTLLATLVEESPRRAIEVILAIARISGTHSQRLLIVLLRDRARDGFPLLTKMVPSLLPLFRRTLTEKIVGMNIAGGIALPNQKRPLLHVRLYKLSGYHARTKFGRQLQAEQMDPEELLPDLNVELNGISTRQQLREDGSSVSKLGSTKWSGGGDRAARAALSQMPKQFDEVADEVVQLDLDVSFEAAFGDDIGVAIVPAVGCVPWVLGQVRRIKLSCSLLRVWWHMPSSRLHIAFETTPRLELENVHLQIPCGSRALKQGSALGDCWPLSSGPMIERCIKRCIEQVLGTFDHDDTIGFNFNRVQSHWRKIRAVYIWRGAKGLKAVSSHSSRAIGLWAKMRG